LVDIRPVLFIDGFLLLILAAAMGIPLAVDLACGHGEWQAFAISLMCTGFIGLALILSCRTSGARDLSIRQAFLVASTGWLFACLFAALPFYFASLRLSLVDGMFETVSGLTTTGATVIRHLDRVAPAILIWRALLQWLGGLGFIITALVLFPKLRIGGMQQFRMESSGKLEKVKPRLSQVGLSIATVYLLLTGGLTIALALAGMSLLEAVCHAMSSLSTGGFSTSDDSLGHFGDAARWVCVVGMLLGGVTFTRYISPWKRGQWAILNDSQIRWYLLTVAIFSLLMTFWNWAERDMDAYDALRQSIFNVVSVVTTTGFHTADYNAWGGFAQVAFFAMAFIGGCTGSAAGGIKVFRYEVLLAATSVHLRRLLHPHGVFAISLNQRGVPETVVRSVLGFMMLYFFWFAMLALALTLTGLDLITGLSGAAAALGNIGPALGNLIGPGGSYQALSDVAKALLVVGMLFGRLELATMMALFTRSFWRE
jgi:trk system potassium uptake protein TrkH